MFTLNFYKMLRAGMTGGTTETITFKNYKGNDDNVSLANTLQAMNTIVTDGRARYKFAETGTSSAGIGNASISDNVASESVFEGINNFKYFNNGTPSTAYLSNERGVVMVLGDGTTEPTVSDYKLENFIGSTTLKCINVTANSNGAIDENSDELATRSWTYENISNASVTVKEVGLVALFSYGDNNSHSALLYREVLKNPVTIDAGKKYRFDFTLGVTF